MCESIYKKRKELKFKYTRKKIQEKILKQKAVVIFYQLRKWVNTWGQKYNEYINFIVISFQFV